MKPAPTLHRPSRRRRLVSVAVAIFGTASAARGQVGDPGAPVVSRREGLASVEGVVVQAGTARPAPEARVYIAGRALPVVADSAGWFRLDSLLPGRYLLTATTGGLDALGLDPAPQVVQLTPGATAHLQLTLPSARAVHALVCPRDAAADTTTALLYGTIGDATGGVLRAAVVTVGWDRWSLGPTGIRTDTAAAQIETDSAGVYRLCGVPRAGALRITASARGASSSTITLPPGLALATQADLDLDVTPDAGARVGTDPNASAASGGGGSSSRGHAPAGVIVGAVTTRSDGRAVTALPGAAVRLTRGPRPAADTAAVAVTDHAGAFGLPAVRAGTQFIEVHAIGYAPQTVRVDLRRGDTARVRVMLAPANGGPGQGGRAVLDTVHVAGHAVLGAPLGRFSRRYERSVGGLVFDRSAIDAVATGHLSDVLRDSPAVEILRDGGRSVVQIRRARNSRILTPGRCDIQYYVDGMPVASAEVDDFSPGDVETIEVFPSSASIPPEFAGARAGCGVIAIWRRTTAGALTP